VFYDIPVDFVIESKEDAEANMCEEHMRQFGKNVITQKWVFCSRKSIRCQVLLGQEMRILHNLTTFPIDKCDETRASGQQRFFGIQWPQIFVKRGRRCRVKVDCKNLRELFNARQAVTLRTERHWNRRCAYFRFSLSTPNNVCS